MKGEIIVAEAVSLNQDGTFSLLRGGIDRVWPPAEGRPIVFRGGLVFRMVAGPTELRRHEFRILFVNEDGKPFAPEISGNVDFTTPGGAVMALGELQLIFPKPGRYVIAAHVDQQEIASYTLTALESPPKK
ncbi:MAG TPA: hypothetical protein VNO22_03815 [Planctomycetota bacterium]|jgi:hypothetical protein|nr:hypothetical protein [Planctomycetota bacterium]